jgi:hypothetical protein
MDRVVSASTAGGAHRPDQTEGVRLSPNVENYAWRNEYVSLVPAGAPDERLVLARTRLFTGLDGVKVMVRRVEIVLDLDTQRVMLPDACPPELVEQAATKAERALELLSRARDERDQNDAPVPRAVLCPVFIDEADTADGPARDAKQASDAASTGACTGSSIPPGHPRVKRVRHRGCPPSPTHTCRAGHPGQDWGSKRPRPATGSARHTQPGMVRGDPLPAEHPADPS